MFFLYLLVNTFIYLYLNICVPNKKKYITSGVVAMSLCCGIWEGENHLTDQTKTLYTKRYFKQAARTEPLHYLFIFKTQDLSHIPVTHTHTHTHTTNVTGVIYLEIVTH